MMKVAIIPAHSETAVGSAVNNLLEYEVNKMIARELCDSLGECCVYLERGTDLEAYTKLPKLINDNNVDIAIEIHTGGSDDDHVTGCEAYYKEGDKFSHTLCKAINRVTAKTTGTNIRGCIPVSETGRGSYLINNTKCTMILIKPCFISSKADYKRLTTNIENYSVKLSDVIIQALRMKGGK